MTPLIASTGSRVADWLWYSAHSVLGVMPVVMALGHRSSTLVIAVAVAVAVALAAMAFEGRLGQWFMDAAHALKTPLGVSVLAFLGFAAVSITWSIAPGTSFRAYFQFALTLGGAFLLAFALPRRMPRAGPLLLAVSVAIACTLIILDLWTEASVRRVVGANAVSFVYNRPVLTVLVFTGPLLWLLAKRDYRWVSLAIMALVAATVLRSDSGAAVLGLVAALGAYGLARVANRSAVSLVGGGIAAAILVAPMMGAVADRVLPPSAHETVAGANSRARVEIWKRFGEAVRQDPVVGGGFGVSPRFSETRIAQEIAPHDPSAFDVSHAHNAGLQAWVELGAIGVILAVVILMLLFARIAKFPRDLLAVSLALAASVAAVSLVGHGAWQGWWAAAIGAAIVWLRYDSYELMKRHVHV